MAEGNGLLNHRSSNRASAGSNPVISATFRRIEMELEDAILHAHEKSIEQRKNGKIVCAEEHGQLASWLCELRAYRKSESLSPTGFPPTPIQEFKREKSKKDPDIMKFWMNGNEKDEK